LAVGAPRTVTTTVSVAQRPAVLQTRAWKVSVAGPVGAVKDGVAVLAPVSATLPQILANLLVKKTLGELGENFLLARRELLQFRGTFRSPAKVLHDPPGNLRRHG